MLNDLLCRFRAAYTAFRNPHLVDGYLIPPKLLHRLEYGPDIAVVDAQWIGDRLVERVHMIPPKESDEIRRHLGFF